MIKKTSIKLQPRHFKAELTKIRNDYFHNKYLLLMIMPVLLFYILFHYMPMYGAMIAFKDYVPARGIYGSTWVGIKHFINFFNSASFYRVIRNTLAINVYQLLFSFPAPILLALLLNEVHHKPFKSAVQTITYMPHFISIMVISGMLVEFLSSNGVITYIFGLFGGASENLLMKARYFRTIYVVSGIWQEVGFGSIVFLGGLSNIDPLLYDAAKIDGAGRFKQMIHVTLSGILPLIMVLFVLRMGRMMSLGYEKIILLYNPATYETADVISSFVYRRGLLEINYSFGAAVGLFNSAVNVTLIVLFNNLSRRLTNNSLW